jgi:hypothetical protein
MREPPGGAASAAVPGFLPPFRLPAFASWVILRPLENGAFLTVGLPAAIWPPDPNGVVVLHMSKTRPGRAPPLPRGQWCAPGRRLSSGRHPPLSSGQSLYPAGTSHLRGQPSRDVIRGSLTFAHHPRTAGCRPGTRKLALPAGLLLARRPPMEREPLRLLPRASHPAVTRDARQGGDGPARTGPGTAPPASAGPPAAPPT